MQTLAWLVPFLLWGIAEWIPHIGIILAIIVFFFIDSMHQLATLPLVTQKKFSIFSSIIIASLALVFSSIPESLPSKIWLSLYLYWGAFHIMRQHYGFLRIEQWKNPPPPPLSRAEVFALYSGIAFPYLLNLSHGWAFETYPGNLAWRLPLPVFIPWIALAIFLLSFGYVVFNTTTFNDRLKLILLSVSNFAIGLLFAGKYNVMLASLFITSFHDVQYLAITSHLAQKRFSHFKSKLVFLAVMLLGAVVIESLRERISFLKWMNFEPTLQRSIIWVFLSYTYMHYLFDTKIWKLKNNPDLLKQ